MANETKRSQLKLFSTRLLTVVITSFLLLLSGCGSDKGPETTENENTNVDQGEGFVYKGDPPVSDEVRRFQENLWDNIRQSDRCGGCHSVEGGNSLQFARIDDINKAYDDVKAFIDLSAPADSPLVLKLQQGTGHSCWKSEDSVCAELLTRWIGQWANVAVGQVNVVELRPPVNKEPGKSKSFPESPASFDALIYNTYLKPHCSDCHKENAATPQSPFIASDNVDEAYLAAMSKISLDTPEGSRLVVRLSDEFHNCWSESCSEDGKVMLTAITDFADGIALTQVDPQHVISRAMKLLDGIASSSGGRNEDSLIALFEFKTGDKFKAFDTSGVDKDMDLNLSGDFEWVGGWGINFINGRAQSEAGQAEKLSRLIGATGEYSIEAWVAPNNVTQEGPARIASFSGGKDDRNFMLGQTLYSYNFLHRSSLSDANGEPALSTSDDDEVLQATLQHVVMTSNLSDGRKIYVNGKLVAQEDTSDTTIGTLNSWDNSFAFILGSETSGEFPFKGVIRLLAVYNKAIPEAQIQTNFEANVGQRYLVMFNVSEITGINEAYVVFEVSQFDNYAYLFNQPFFVSLDKEANYSGVALEGMHIGINGKRATSGQAFNLIKTSLDKSAVDENGRQPLSSLGTVIALEKGVAHDEFYLIFDKLGDKSFVIVDAEPEVTTPVYSTVEQSDIGIKTFDEINLSMARMTGIDLNYISPDYVPLEFKVDVAATFEVLEQQLPSTTDIGTFLSSHQIGITQLAIEYCSALVDDTSLRAAYFPQLVFNAPLTDRNLLLDPLINKIAVNKVNAVELVSEPSDIEIKSDLDDLIDKLCDGNCSADKTVKIAKASCATVLASAIILFQ
ncbi:MAG: LamG domain-containing protein [Pseudomonadales bacterium]|nr:LamG domain-containing protein [Pseudomonadales bacterium]